MRRAMLAALSVIALALASPGAALAHHHGHRGHHKGRAKAHHARVRFEHFGAPASSADITAGSDGEVTKATSPTEAVGTVASFENEVLTVALNDGSTVKGRVSSDTKIECMTASPTPSSSEGSSGDDKGSGDDERHEGDHQSSDEEGQSKEDEGDDNSETAASEPPCGTAAITPGTGVREAELKIGSAGAEFENVELVK